MLSASFLLISSPSPFSYWHPQSSTLCPPLLSPTVLSSGEFSRSYIFTHHLLTSWFRSRMCSHSSLLNLGPISFGPLAKAPGVSQIQLTRNIIYCLPLTVPNTLYLVAQAGKLWMAEVCWLLQDPDSEMELRVHRSGVCTHCAGAVSSPPHSTRKGKVKSQYIH